MRSLVNILLFNYFFHLLLYISIHDLCSIVMFDFMSALVGDLADEKLPKVWDEAVFVLVVGDFVTPIVIF